MSYPDKAEVMRAADLYADTKGASRWASMAAVRDENYEAQLTDRAALEAKLDQLYAALDARKGAQIVYSPDAKAMSDRVKALEAALAEANRLLELARDNPNAYAGELLACIADERKADAIEDKPVSQPLSDEVEAMCHELSEAGSLPADWKATLERQARAAAMLRRLSARVRELTDEVEALIHDLERTMKRECELINVLKSSPGKGTTQKLESAFIDDGYDHPNEEIIRAKYGYIEIGGFSSGKRRLLAEAILHSFSSGKGTTQETTNDKEAATSADAIFERKHRGSD